MSKSYLLEYIEFTVNYLILTLRVFPGRRKLYFPIENNYPVPIFLCENLHI